MSSLIRFLVVGIFGTACAKTPCPPGQVKMPSSEEAPTESERITHLATSSRIPVIDRDALLMAGYFDAFGRNPGDSGLWFAAMEPSSQYYLNSSLGRTDGTRTVAGLEHTVDRWLAHGKWSPMHTAKRIGVRPETSSMLGGEKWEFRELGLSVYATARGVLNFSIKGVHVGRSPDVLRVGPNDFCGNGNRVAIQQLAFDPQTNLVWLVLAPTGPNAMECLGGMDLVRTFYLLDVRRYHDDCADAEGITAPDGSRGLPALAGLPKCDPSGLRELWNPDTGQGTGAFSQDSP